MKKFFFLLFLAKLSGYSQIITTIAGNGIGAYTGDGGPATSASFSEPQNVVLDDTGNVYVVDEDDNVIRKINLSGIINTVIGNGGIGWSGDGGQAKLAKLNSPGGAAIDRKGNIYIADSYNHVIRKVNTAGIISTIAGHGTISGYGGDGGPGVAAYLNFPEMVAVDKRGNVYVADASNNRIRKIDTAGIITTIAGIGTGAYSGDNGPATAAELYYPTGIVVDTSTGIIYIGDANNNAVRKIDTFGIITTFAGTGVMGYSGNGGLATSARLNKPQGVTIDTAGTVYISDGGNNAIRKVNTSGIISTYVGRHSAGFSGDGGPAFLARIFNPPGITVDVAGNLYIAEYYNSRVRKVSYCPVPLNFAISGTFSLCVGDSVALTASGATTYTWSLNADSVLTASAIVKPVVNTTYYVVGVTDPCASIDSALVTVITCGSGIDEKNEKGISLYPNPTNGLLFIQSNEIENAHIEIYNSIGEAMYSAVFSPLSCRRGAGGEVDMSQLNNGMYFVRIFKDAELLHQRTIIKQ